MALGKNLLTFVVLKRKICFVLSELAYNFTSKMTQNELNAVIVNRITGA
jgi:hypothetical protein